MDIVNDDIFFSDDETDQFEATEFCNGTVDNQRCPLRDQCLMFAMETNTEYGVYGGMTQLARKAMRKKFSPKRQKTHPAWRYMTQEEALMDLSLRDISDLKKSLSDG